MIPAYELLISLGIVSMTSMVGLLVDDLWYAVPVQDEKAVVIARAVHETVRVYCGPTLKHQMRNRLLSVQIYS